MGFRCLAAAMTLLLATCLPAVAAIGDIDPMYGQNGRIADFPLLLTDGRVLGPSGDGYQRLDTSGHPDAGFGNQGKQTWPDGFRPNWNVWLRQMR